MTWDRTPLGLEPPLLHNRALRWLGSGRKNAKSRWYWEGSGAAPGG